MDDASAARAEEEGVKRARGVARGNDDADEDHRALPSPSPHIGRERKNSEIGEHQKRWLLLYDMEEMKRI